jgi:hypothetical protein
LKPIISQKSSKTLNAHGSEESPVEIKPQGFWSGAMASQELKTGKVTCVKFLSSIQCLVWGTEDGYLSVYKMEGGDFNTIAKSVKKVETVHF